VTQTDVILIADRWYGKRLEAVPNDAAVWIVDSQHNQAAILARRAAGLDGSVTAYKDNFQFSPDEAAATTLSPIVAQHPQIAYLTIIGVPLTPVLAATIADFGFALKARDAQGLQFIRARTEAQPALDTTLALARIIATSGTRDTPHVDERTWWFAQRNMLPGWGHPVCWQGWAVLIAYTVLLVGPMSQIARVYGKHPPFFVLAYAGALTAALIAVVAAKGEPTRR
jgi:hypothetical protein